MWFVVCKDENLLSFLLVSLTINLQANDLLKFWHLPFKQQWSGDLDFAGKCNWPLEAFTLSEKVQIYFQNPHLSATMSFSFKHSDLLIILMTAYDSLWQLEYFRVFIWCFLFQTFLLRVSGAAVPGLASVTGVDAEHSLLLNINIILPQYPE